MYIMHMISLSLDRLSGRNEFTLENVNFRRDIRQNFFLKKSQNIKSVCSF